MNTDQPIKGPHSRVSAQRFGLLLAMLWAPACAKSDDANPAGGALARQAQQAADATDAREVSETSKINEPSTAVSEELQLESDRMQGNSRDLNWQPGSQGRESKDEDRASEKLDAADALGGRRIGQDNKGDAGGEAAGPVGGNAVGTNVAGSAKRSPRRKAAGSSESGVGSPQAVPRPTEPTNTPYDEEQKPRSTTKKSKAAPKQEPALAHADQLLTKLGALEIELRGAGVVLPHDAFAATGDAPPADDASPKQIDCVQVCELAEAICDLEIRICALSRAHSEDDRYADACVRAGGDCRAGSEVCNACE